MRADEFLAAVTEVHSSDGRSLLFYTSIFVSEKCKQGSIITNHGIKIINQTPPPLPPPKKKKIKYKIFQGNHCVTTNIMKI